MKTKLDPNSISDVDNYFNRIERALPGFKEMLNDRRKARPFERKIKKVANLKKDDGCYYNWKVMIQTKPSNTQEYRRFATMFLIKIMEFDKFGQTKMVPNPKAYTHILTKEYKPIIFSDHCMLQYSKRTGCPEGDLFNDEHLLRTVDNFADEFWMRGDPISPHCGLKTKQGILLGQWLKPTQIDDDFELYDQLWIMWNHRKGLKNIWDFSDYTKVIDNVEIENPYVFFAKTFITDEQASATQLIQAKAYIDNSQQLQRFRRDGHTDVWTN